MLFTDDSIFSSYIGTAFQIIFYNAGIIIMVIGHKMR